MTEQSDIHKYSIVNIQFRLVRVGFKNRNLRQEGKGGFIKMAARHGYAISGKIQLPFMLDIRYWIIDI